MGLFSYFGMCVIFSALVAAMASAGNKLDKALPAILIAIEVILLLVTKGAFKMPEMSESDARRYGCALVTIAAFFEFIRRQDKAFPLLAFFAALTQLLVVLNIVQA